MYKPQTPISTLVSIDPQRSAVTDKVKFPAQSTSSRFQAVAANAKPIDFVPRGADAEKAFVFLFPVEIAVRKSTRQDVPNIADRNVRMCLPTGQKAQKQ